MLEVFEKTYVDIESAKKKRKLPKSNLWVQYSFDRSKPTLKLSDGQCTIELTKKDIEALKAFMVV